MLDRIEEPSDIVQVYSQLSYYPILAPQIRERMREELFRRGIVRPDRLEEEVKDRAIISQTREGLNNPLFEEDEGIWLQRLRFIRDYLTDFYFAHNLPIELLYTIVGEVVGQRTGRVPRDELHFNPELAPLEMLLNKAQQYEMLPPEDKVEVQHHLEEIIVVLVRTVISDQLNFVRIAKAYFTVDDFRAIRSRRIGNGKIGGKAAGMLLAQKILEVEAPELAQHITVPESYFIGADVFYDFISLNNLEYNQKYKTADQIRAEYPVIRAEYEKGRFPEEVAERLRAILDRAGNTPLIVPRTV